MIDHTGVPVSDMTRSKAWYTQALAPIGYGLLMEVPGEVTGHHAAVGVGETLEDLRPFDAQEMAQVIAGARA